jgi:hypothetical protein
VLLFRTVIASQNCTCPATNIVNTKHLVERRDVQPLLAKDLKHWVGSQAAHVYPTALIVVQFVLCVCVCVRVCVYIYIYVVGPRLYDIQLYDVFGWSRRNSIRDCSTQYIQLYVSYFTTSLVVRPKFWVRSNKISSLTRHPFSAPRTDLEIIAQVTGLSEHSEEETGEKSAPRSPSVVPFLPWQL